MKFTPKGEAVDAVQLKWTTWSELTSLVAAAGLKAEGGFINQHGQFVTAVPPGPAKMGARLINDDGSTHLCHESQWVIVRPDTKRRVQVLDDEAFRKRYGYADSPDVITALTFRPRSHEIKLDTSAPIRNAPPETIPDSPFLTVIPNDIPRSYRPGQSFSSVMQGVREGIEEAKRELGLE